MKQLSEQSIKECLNRCYGVKVSTIALLPLGADINASIYQVIDEERRAYFVKVRPGKHYDVTAALLMQLHEAGIEQIIPPIPAQNGQITQDIEGLTLIVYPFVKGVDGFSHHLTDDQWYTLGKVMRQIHAVKPSVAIKTETYSSQWRERVRHLFDHINSGKTVSDELGLNLLRFLQEHKEIILRLVNRAHELAHKIQEQTAEFVLCHSDMHGGNVLIEETGSIYIVDWDDPIMAPKERDLMFIGGGVANVWNNPHEEELFYKGYGKTQINRDILAYYRCERIVEDIAIYGQHILLTPANIEDRPTMYKHLLAMFEPRGVVDIALKT